jgi:hypothetical protein
MWIASYIFEDNETPKRKPFRACWVVYTDVPEQCIRFHVIPDSRSTNGSLRTPMNIYYNERKNKPEEIDGHRANTPIKQTRLPNRNTRRGQLKNIRVVTN